jgi:hypothetical protein
VLKGAGLPMASVETEALENKMTFSPRLDRQILAELDSVPHKKLGSSSEDNFF